jgi:hypothetical protein
VPDLIRVAPAPERRTRFAAWAVAQVPKVRTVEANVFAVPAGLFTQVPEEALIGALVDGRRYVSPDEPGQGGEGESAELLGVAAPEALTPPPAEITVEPGEPLPEADPAGYGSDSVPLVEAADEETGQEERPEPDGDEAGEGFECDLCDRTFTTDRGRDIHRRRAHPDA